MAQRLPRAAEPIEWRDVADVLPAIAFVVRADGTVEFTNRVWHEYTGAPRGGESGAALASFVHPGDVAAVVEAYRLAASTGMPFDAELRLADVRGAYRRFHVLAVPYPRGAGRAQRYFGIAYDIEEQQRAIALRERSETLLQTFLQSVPQIVWTADASGSLEWYNRRWYEYTGQTVDEAAGWGWQAAHHPDDLPEVMLRWPHSIATGEPFEMEFRLKRADGEFHWFLTRVVPALDREGRVVRWYGSNTDIEEQKRAQQSSARIAQTLREAFLPAALPARDDLRFDAMYLPADREALVGGDWYDAIVLPDGRVFVSCGDVTGHGIAAAIAGVRLRQAVAFAAIEDPDPARVLERVNHALRFVDGTVATAAVAVVDPAARTFDYALAGHPAPVVAFERDRVGIEPHADAPPLGVVDVLHATTRSLAIEPDGFVVFYTDGVTEFAREIEGAERRLVDAARALAASAPGPHAAHAIQRAVMGGATSPDDTALLVVRFAPSEVPDAAAPSDGLVKTWRFHSSDAYTARLSRGELIRFLDELALESEDLYTAELVLGELLANSVEHAPGLVEIVIDWRGEHPVVVMRDSGPGMLAFDPRLPRDPLREKGRGMFIVAAFANDVSVVRRPEGGSEVRATLPLSR